MTPAELRSTREKLGLTQAGLGRLTGRTERLIGMWEAGDRTIDPAVILLLRMALELPAVRKWLGL